MQKVQLVFLLAHKYARWKQWYIWTDPNTTLKKGDIVEAPFGQTRQMAIVFAIEPMIESDITDYKTIGRIVRTKALPESIVDVLQTLSLQYFCSPSYFLQKIFPDQDIDIPCLDAVQPPSVLSEIAIGPQFSQKNKHIFDTIHRCLTLKQSVLFVFPSVFAVLHAHAYFSRLFPNTLVRCWHSALTKAQKKSIRDTMMREEGSIFIATPSVVLSPKLNWGVVIIHEYTDDAYKELQFPYIHLGKLVLEWCQSLGIPYLASSLQGSVDDWYSNTAQMRLYPAIYTPTVQIVDMNLEKENGNASPFSAVALQKIKECIAQKKQVLLFLNKKGLHWSAMCEQCFYTPLSPFSGLKMSVFPHKNGSVVLRCTQSGYTQVLDPQCPQCGGTWKMMGSGTQEIEHILPQYFPEARIVRIDKDAMNGIKTMKQTIMDIINNTVDILVCTSFATKGLAFLNVALVVDMVADTHFLFSSLGGEEESLFQLRSLFAKIGSPHESEYIIQTNVPRAPVFMDITNYTTQEWVQKGIKIRRYFHQPPFSKAVVLIKNAKKKSTLEEHFLMWQKKYTPWFYQLFPPTITFYEKKQLYEGKMEGYLAPQFHGALFDEPVEVHAMI